MRVLLACACLLLGACGRDDAGGIAGFGAQPAAGTVEAAVNSAVETRRLATATQETRQATPGTHFVLLDVTARNTDRQPQVFSEGSLISVSASHERRFATPVSMLADEFLTLQVLKPSARVRGKIAYEVPDHLPGVLYWAPGTGSQRILLRVGAAAGTTTSANAVDDAIDEASASANAADDAAGDATTSASAADDAADAASAPVAGTNAIATVSRDIATPALPAVAASAPGPEQPAVRSASNAAGADTRTASAAPARPVVAARNEPARNLACQSLVSRNDPAEKERYLGFFSRECSGYAMPAAWRARPVAEASAPPVADDRLATRLPAASVPANTPRWPPRPGPAFNCAQAYTRAEHLICEDAVLSLMDWELNRAFAQASRVVDDPAGLQRDEDSWRHRVRDACGTSRCIESVYDQRTAHLEALADRQR